MYFTRTRRAISRPDLTAMVDIAFILLISLVVLNKMRTPTTTDLHTEQRHGCGDKDRRYILHLLLDSAGMVHFLPNDTEDDAVPSPPMPLEGKHNIDLIRKRLTALRVRQGTATVRKTGKQQIMLAAIVHPHDQAQYKHTIRILSVVQQAGIDSYTIEDLSPLQEDFIRTGKVRCRDYSLPIWEPIKFSMPEPITE